MKNRLIWIVCLICGLSSLQAQQNVPYKNPLLPTEVRVNDLLQRMTLKEKIAQICHLHSITVFDGQQLNKKKLAQMCVHGGYGFFEGFPLTATSTRKAFREIQTYLIEQTRLGIPGFSVAESLHGVVQDGATIYPQNIALGSTFSVDLAYAKTRQIAGELNTMGVKQVLAPCIDVVRDLRWGRVEESFGEDPFLCSRMAVAEVKGYMEHGISPMLKHYGPHGNPLGGINLASVECGVRDLFDIYLKPFETVCKETGVMAVMSSYNAWNREPNSASHFMLTEILRNTFGFRGYVYSDWGVIDMLIRFHKTAADSYEAASQVMKAGLDVEASSICFLALEEKVLSGEFDVKFIDQAVRRVLRTKFELGLFEDPYQEKANYRIPIHTDESVALSKRIADESTVLLKNENNLLPLDINGLKSIAVVGPNADCVQFGDYTWSKNKKDGVTPLQGIQKLVGKKVKVNYAKGCSIASLDTSGIDEAVQAAQQSDVAIVFVGSSSAAFVRHSAEPSTSGEGIDLSDIALTGAQNDLIRAVKATGKPVVVVLVAGKPFAIPYVKEAVPAVLAQWYAGEQAGTSIADILFGNVNPSGKTPFSFPQSTGHLPVYYNHLSTDKGYYKEPGSYENPGRDYVFSSPDPLWVFGHGLSYTTFDFEKVSVDKQQYYPYDTIQVSVQLKNTGKMEGKEVIQVYVRDMVSSVMTPVKQLKAFTKVGLRPGELKKVNLSIPVSELFLTDNQGKRFLEPGTFELQVGSSSESITSRIRVEVGEPALVSSNTSESMAQEMRQVNGKIIEIKGCVRDVQGTPVHGVRIQSSFSQNEISTDKNGNYIILAHEDERLLFSKVGYVTQKQDIQSRKQISIQIVKGE